MQEENYIEKKHIIGEDADTRRYDIRNELDNRLDMGSAEGYTDVQIAARHCYESMTQVQQTQPE